MLAGTSCSTPLRVTQPARSPPPGRLLLPKTPRKPLIDHPELVAVACPDCRCSPVEVLMIHSQRRFFVVSTVSRHLGCQSLAIPHRSEARCNRARVPSHASSALVMVAVPQHRHLVCRRDCSFHVSPLEAFSSQEFTASVIRQAGDLRMLGRFRATGSRGHAAGRMSTYRRHLRLVCVVLTDGMSRYSDQLDRQPVATSSACEPHSMRLVETGGGSWHDQIRGATRWRQALRSKLRDALRRHGARHAAARPTRFTTSCRGVRGRGS
jgi:hypothetical protein